MLMAAMVPLAIGEHTSVQAAVPSGSCDERSWSFQAARAPARMTLEELGHELFRGRRLERGDLWTIRCGSTMAQGCTFLMDFIRYQDGRFKGLQVSSDGSQACTLQDLALRAVYSAGELFEVRNQHPGSGRISRWLTYGPGNLESLSLDLMRADWSLLFQGVVQTPSSRYGALARGAAVEARSRWSTILFDALAKITELLLDFRTRAASSSLRIGVRSPWHRRARARMLLPIWSGFAIAAPWDRGSLGDLSHLATRGPVAVAWAVAERARRTRLLKLVRGTALDTLFFRRSPVCRRCHAWSMRILPGQPKDPLAAVGQALARLATESLNTTLRRARHRRSSHYLDRMRGHAGVLFRATAVWPVWEALSELSTRMCVSIPLAPLPRRAWCFVEGECRTVMHDSSRADRGSFPVCAMPFHRTGALKVERAGRRRVAVHRHRWFQAPQWYDVFYSDLVRAGRLSCPSSVVDDMDRQAIRRLRSHLPAGGAGWRRPVFEVVHTHFHLLDCLAGLVARWHSFLDIRAVAIDGNPSAVAMAELTVRHLTSEGFLHGSRSTAEGSWIRVVGAIFPDLHRDGEAQDCKGLCNQCIGRPTGMPGQLREPCPFPLLHRSDLPGLLAQAGLRRPHYMVISRSQTLLHVLNDTVGHGGWAEELAGIAANYLDNGAGDWRALDAARERGGWQLCDADAELGDGAGWGSRPLLLRRDPAAGWRELRAPLRHGV